ncbi:MAG: class I SAM-dependent methyltransferase [Pseudomonadota bacterium]
MSYSRRAAIYEVEYQDTRDVPFVLSLLQGGVSWVIEAPCGAGRLSRHLAPRLAALDVIDLEPGMVARAVSAARSASATCQVTGHVQDMRDITLDSRADLAILPREGLQLVPPEDGKRVLASLARYLVPGGVIFVDLARFCHSKGAPDPDYFRPCQADGRASLDWSRKLPDGGILHRSSSHRDEGGSLVFDLTYVQESVATQKWSSQMRIFRYSIDWLEASAPPGTRLEKLYGAYDRTPPGPASRRILALFRKAFDTT